MKTINKVFWGLFFITAAVFVIFDAPGGNTIKLIPLLLTIFIAAMFIKSIYHGNIFGILFSLAFLSIIYSKQLGLGNLTPWPVLAAAFLGSIGLSIIFGRHHYCRGCNHEHFDKIISDKDDSEINYEVSFGSSIKYVNSDNFKSANLKSSFGALKVYFDNAKIKGDEATINIDVSFSGVELYLPKEWKIINKVDNTLGTVEEKNRNKNEFDKTVTLTGHVNLGGVEIIYI